LLSVQQSRFDNVWTCEEQRSYDGERRTVKKTLQLTPSEDRALTEAADEQGATWSDYSRELLLHRSAAVVAATRRSPEAKAIIKALDDAAYEHNANGNNLNQIARHLNTTGDLRDWGELREALTLQRKAAELHIVALQRVLGL
jgi:hypothetical protein